MCSNKKQWTPTCNMCEAQKHNAGWKKSDTEEHILHDTIQFKFKNSQKSEANNYSDKSRHPGCHPKARITAVSGAQGEVLYLNPGSSCLTLLHKNSNSILKIWLSYYILLFQFKIFHLYTEPEKKKNPLKRAPALPEHTLAPERVRLQVGNANNKPDIISTSRQNPQEESTNYLRDFTTFDKE